MPNWCENVLTVTGDRKELDRFKAFAKTKRSNLDFNAFVPYPAKYKRIDRVKDNAVKAYKAKREAAGYDQMAKSAQYNWLALHPDPEYDMKDGFNSGGYEWCVHNWGTKWWVEAELVYEDDKVLEYSFDTAWSPPLPVVEKMGAMFKSLTFNLRYEEEGMDFRGEVEIENGVLTKDEQE